ncbi:MAG: glutamate--tRNA ligase [Proteobacteria bacterium]|nr:glutamate--tRNA ligase [Pseudomonadota bacterium]
MTVRTRIAPSPTGFLHLGTARTALYSWAYARHHGGQFVLRIEDTDVARSTQEATEQILQAMRWLGLAWDEGPIYQMQRLDRYREVIASMLSGGGAYHCYTTPEELAAQRAEDEAAGRPPRGYDGRWRPEPGKVLPPVPAGVTPVVRFKNPQDGAVTWDDLVKGPITVANKELDDLIIQRSDGVPTYNFAVVVDDWDMAISHVFRGEEHINNTPWQINIYRALGAPLPRFGHLPVILGDDGKKLSKRRGAVSVTAYAEAGYLPEGMLNYLARLGWSHGDDELFTAEQMVAWFDGSHLNKSPAQWDAAKLAWVNAHHLKAASGEQLAPLVAAQLARQGLAEPPALPALCALYKDRCTTTVELADWVALHLRPPVRTPELEALWQRHEVAARAPALAALRARLAEVEWTAPAIAAAIKAVLAEQGLKMPQLAIPLRLVVTGRDQTPAIDAVLALFSRDDVLTRLQDA